jgi:predicted site-specific integrase-resolvase
MAKQDQLLTTREFASRAGIPTSTVTKLIKVGKVRAEKKSGKWMIAADQLKSEVVKGLSAPVKPTAKKKPSEKKPPAPAKEKPTKAKTSAGKTYSIAEFAAMTYLTEKGVRDWLKQGRLAGQQDQKGDWQLDSSNLDKRDVKRLIR